MAIDFSLKELTLALKRVEHDHKYRVFVTRRAEWLVLRAQREQWLERLHGSITSGTYVPSPAAIADVPKGAGAVRSACLLSLTDEVVYTVAVGRIIASLADAQTWAKPHPDCSYLLRKPATVDWISNPFHCNAIWRKRSLALLAPPTDCVVITDITSYYDAILHEALLSDLKGVGVDASLADYLVGKLLSRWAIVNGRGIPQGLSASDLLAKLYLNTVDLALYGAGVRHLRYVDDIRIYCDSGADARRGLLHLQALLRARGLALQTAKTRILRPDKAKALFEGIQPVLAPLARNFTASIAKAAGLESDYLPPTEAAKVLSTLPSPPTDLLREAYEAYLMDESVEFNRTLFRYIVGQLGRAKDGFALNHSISLMVEHPEETSSILSYVARAEKVAEVDSTLLRQLLSAESIYPYQHYQYLQWRLGQTPQASEELLKYTRDVCAATRSPAYVVSVARLVLGKFGSTADLEQLKSHYGSTESDAAKIDLVCALQEMETGQRNAFYGQVVNDGSMVAAAVELAKAGRVHFGPSAL